MLGPLLYIIYSADLAYEVEKYCVSCKAFADDVKLYSVIVDMKSLDNVQLAIDAVYQWSINWQLPIAINKCYALDITPNRSVEEVHPNHIGGVELDLVDSARDFGVIFDKHLTFSKHISTTVAKAK